MGQAGPADPAAAEHSVAVIEHRRLARRNRTRRRVENEFSLPGVRAEIELRRYRALRRAKLCRYHHAVGRWSAEPIQRAESNSSFGQSGSWTDDHTPPFLFSMPPLPCGSYGPRYPGVTPDWEWSV